MRHGREAYDVGVAGRRWPDADRRQRRHHRLDQQAVLLGLLDRPEQAGGEGVVLLGAGAAAHGPGHRARGDLVAPTADQQLGAGAHEPAGGVGEARRVAVAQPVEHRPAVERRTGLDGEPPGEHDLADVAGVDGGEDPADGLRPHRPAGILPHSDVGARPRGRGAVGAGHDGTPRPGRRGRGAVPARNPRLRCGIA